MVDPAIATAAAISIGLAGLGAGYGIGATGSASIGAIAEKPEMFGKTMVYVAFAEAIAIYGLLIAFMLLFNIGA
jgi:V/A-type H+-transporting ATPase subunit K